MKTQIHQNRYFVVFFKTTLYLLILFVFSRFSLADESIIDQNHKLPEDYEAQWERLVSDVEPKLLGGGGGIDPHLEILKQSQYPSAALCGRCHQRIFTEWASSNHAYASISPMFHKFEQAVNALTSGTMGSFCVRCHQQVGTQIGEPRESPLWERSLVAREGITCITCHRVNQSFFKVNGERHVNPGSIYEPVYNTGDAPGVAEVIAERDFYKISTSPEEEGFPIHGGAKVFETIG